MDTRTLIMNIEDKIQLIQNQLNEIAKEIKSQPKEEITGNDSSGRWPIGYYGFPGSEQPICIHCGKQRELVNSGDFLNDGRPHKLYLCLNPVCKSSDKERYCELNGGHKMGGFLWSTCKKCGYTPGD